MSEKIYNHDEILTLVTPIFERHGVTQAKLFGSYARGDATPKSDIDFVVRYEKTPSLWTFCGLIEDLEVAFEKECHVVTQCSLEKDKSELAEIIERSTINVYG
ncbi:MAG: nucleotidyltransferase domain-containing protein [Defluviitaleaceae bacterium]|nr:nucleotidyltransferase domain-containing protein [Defluviitaleaceae bacterium]